MGSHEKNGKLLELPMYSAAEASRLVGLSSARIHRWLQGYSYEYGSRIHSQLPVIKRTGNSRTSYASFLDLVDLLFAKKFVDHGISLQKVRKALDEARDILHTEHFARRIFFTDGKNIYLKVQEKGEAILQLLSHGQWVIPQVIKELADQIEFDQPSGLARRWYPLGTKGLIVLDPYICFGRPTIVGKGVDTLNVYDLFVAENREATAVSRWLSLTTQEVEAAVKFEQKLAA